MLSFLHEQPCNFFFNNPPKLFIKLSSIPTVVAFYLPLDLKMKWKKVLEMLQIYARHLVTESAIPLSENAITTLCDTCKTVTVKNLTSRLFDFPTGLNDIGRFGGPVDGTGMWHLKIHDLIESSQNCALCALIIAAALGPGSRELTDELSGWEYGGPRDFSKHPPGDEFGPYEILLTPLLRDDGSLNDGLHGINIWIPKKDVYGFIRPMYPSRSNSFNSTVRYQLSVSVKPRRLFGNPRSITARPPLPSSNCPEAHSLLKSWLASCVRHHKGCRETISGKVLDERKESMLPTRVIDVGPPDGSRDPRLMISKGGRGHYIAVSHCWGKHQPLKTEKHSLDDRIQGIPWDTLPKTFQDVITVARALGIRYVWIDSLCIVQGDKEDWHREAARMGYVYERARLTIVASHAKDSTEGLFFERTPPRQVQIPHVNSFGFKTGSIIVSADLPGEYYTDGNETCGPLSQRAWITQEWMLSRRMVFYTKSNLIWVCKTRRSNEQNICLGGFYNTEYPLWRSVVETHSRRNLTYLSDRLVSLEGLRTLMASQGDDETQSEDDSRGDDEYRFGMWKHDLPRDLYWAPDGKADRAENPIEPRVASWSWASSMVPVSFEGEIYGPASWVDMQKDDDAVFEFENEYLLVKEGRLVEASRLSDRHSNASFNFDEEEELPLHDLSCLYLWWHGGGVDDRRFVEYSYFLILQWDEALGAYLRVGRGFSGGDRGDESFDWSSVPRTSSIHIK
ncbi:heterokaryon incompatibility protein-domain-containing protein [Annulohypoxylon moriforme]|nr:heterokaryon incompatibility protein-domain-containing protein [Annulohypoxylon moriforme]